MTSNFGRSFALEEFVDQKHLRNATTVLEADIISSFCRSDCLSLLCPTIITARSSIACIDPNSTVPIIVIVDTFANRYVFPNAMALHPMLLCSLFLPDIVLDAQRFPRLCIRYYRDTLPFETETLPKRFCFGRSIFGRSERSRSNERSPLCLVIRRTIHFFESFAFGLTDAIFRFFLFESYIVMRIVTLFNANETTLVHTHFQQQQLYFDTSIFFPFARTINDVVKITVYRYCDCRMLLSTADC